jgi:hypothetical protein
MFKSDDDDDDNDLKFTFKNSLLFHIILKDFESIFLFLCFKLNLLLDLKEMETIL